MDSILAFGFLGSIDFKSRDQNTPLKIKNAWVLPRLLFASSKERQCNRDWYFLSPSHKPSLPKRNQVQTQSTEQPFGLEMPDATTCTKPNKTLRPTEKMFSTLLTFQKVVDSRLFFKKYYSNSGRHAQTQGVFCTKQFRVLPYHSTGRPLSKSKDQNSLSKATLLSKLRG